jgi:hypothetical protein
MLIIGDLNNTIGGRKCCSMVQVAYGDAHTEFIFELDYIDSKEEKRV